MVKLWIIIVVMLGMNPEGNKDIYIFDNPKHESSEVCKEYVMANAVELMFYTQTYYGPNRPIEQIYCVPEDKLPGIVLPPSTENKFDADSIQPEMVDPDLLTI